MFLSFKIKLFLILFCLNSSSFSEIELSFEDKKDEILNKGRL